MAQEELDFMYFPVLALLGRRAMTAREICHALKMNRKSVYLRLRQMIEQNLIVQRVDKKYVPIVKLMVERPEAVATERILERKPIEEPGGFEHSPKIEPEIEKKIYKPKVPASAGEQAKRVALHFRVPAVISGREAHVGQVALCVHCQKPTPLKYGGTALCPICARDDTREG